MPNNYLLTKSVNSYKQQTIEIWENKRFVPIGKNKERVRFMLFARFSLDLCLGERRERIGEKGWGKQSC